MRRIQCGRLFVDVLKDGSVTGARRSRLRNEVALMQNYAFRIGWRIISTLPEIRRGR